MSPFRYRSRRERTWYKESCHRRSHSERLRRYWLGKDETRKEMGPSPTSCPFANRCVRVQRRGRSEHPSLRELGPRHFVRCHFPVER